MYVFGITGGTGSGKTTALEALRLLGAVVIDCDAVYHRLLSDSAALRAAIEARFGDVFSNGELDRKKLGARVFSAPEELEALNRITHAFVTEAVSEILDKARTEGKALAAIDAIALVESGIARLCDCVVAVTAPVEVRIRRLMAREGISEDYARLRIAAQKSDDWFYVNCDLVLVNDGTLEQFQKTCINKFTGMIEGKERKMNIFETLESDVRSYSRSFPVVFNRAKMSKMYAEDGREYLDFFNGAGALAYGHNNDYIKAKILEYIENDGISHALDLFTSAKGAFFEAFRDKILIPGGYPYKLMSCAPTGTNGVEAALKLCRKATGRSGIFAFTGSFHGMTLGSLSVTSGKTVRHGAGTQLSGVTFIPHPNNFMGRGAAPEDVIAYMERVITDEYSGVDKPAAVILETVQAEGGVIVMPEQFLRDLRALCDKYDIKMIVDDIQVGCGRTGKFFSFERAGITPDVVVLSKSISGYGLPMSLVLLKPELDVFTPGEHNGTFRGNQMAFVGAKAALELRELEHLEQKTADNHKFITEYIEQNILPLDSRLEHRGLGMIHGIDFEPLGESGLATRVAHACFENGLIIERAGRDDCVLKIMPALTIPRAELEQGLDIIVKSMKQVL